MMPPLSVIVCTHNPRADYLSRVLAALGAQLLAADQWELLVVDNCSNPPIGQGVAPNLRCRHRVIREEKLGLTAARLRGITESTGDPIVFVDDDNVLQSDYLLRCTEIWRAWPELGAWGGRIEPEFETPPPDWSRPSWPQLAIRSLEKDRWSNLPMRLEVTPSGAGLCVRSSVAHAYREKVLSDPVRVRLDRRGGQLSSCGDTDLAWTACDLGLGTGLFHSLCLTHLIPATRLTEDYLLRLREETEFSMTLLRAARGVPVESWQQRSVANTLRYWRRVWQLKGFDRRSYIAARRGLLRALDEIAASPASQSACSTVPKLKANP